MTEAKLAIGSKVRTSDGHDLGEVERFVVDPSGKHISDFVVDKGIFDQGRVVSLNYVTSITEKEVLLSITREQADGLPGFAVQEFVQMQGDFTVPTAFGGMVNLQGTTGAWMHYGPGAGGGITNVGGQSLFEPAPIGQVITETVGPLTESEFTLDHGTDVISSDGEKIGKVDEVLLGDDNEITGFVVQAGFLFHHDIAIPAEWVANITHEHVHLNVTKAKAEQAKR
jgi:uncharacterized protein YrrD